MPEPIQRPMDSVEPAWNMPRVLRSSRVLEPFRDSLEDRGELAVFLARSFSDPNCVEPVDWLDRMAYWWDRNPAAKAHECRGWVLREKNRLVGYLGVIPSWYRVGERMVPALIGTSWAIDDEARGDALSMGLSLCRMGQEQVLIQTTPSANVQRLMIRAGWESETIVHRTLMPARRSLLRLGRVHPVEPGSGRRLTCSLGDVNRVATRADDRNRLQRWITPEYLRWYCESPMRRHRFLGVVDEEGCLSSYIVVAEVLSHGIPHWSVVDWYTAEEEQEELSNLPLWFVHRPELAGGEKRFLMALYRYGEKNPWKKLPSLQNKVCPMAHFYFKPQAFSSMAKRCVLSEGDEGL